jgi:hypothetical protein
LFDGGKIVGPKNGQGVIWDSSNGAELLKVLRLWRISLPPTRIRAKYFPVNEPDSLEVFRPR